MQCRRCGFENMPGLTVCMQCHAVLTGDVAIDIHPPRAGWRNVYRPAVYGISRLCDRVAVDLDESLFHFGQPFRRTFGAILNVAKHFDDILWAVLSIVPGLGHLVSKRWRTGLWMAAAWLVMAAAGIFLFGSTPGSILLGLAVCFHAWIICDAGRLIQPQDSLRARTLFMLLVIAALSMGLFRGAHLLIDRTGIIGAGIATDFPACSLRAGDYLLFQSKAYLNNGPHRGDLVLYQASGIRVSEVWFPGGEVIGLVLGLPGETISFPTNDTMIVKGPDKNGHNASTAYHVPNLWPWLIGNEFQLTENTYYCLVSPFNEAYRGHRMPNSMHLREIMAAIGKVPGRESVRGQASMLYQPFWRRASLQNQPLIAVSPNAPPAKAQEARKN